MNIKKNNICNIHWNNLLLFSSILFLSFISCSEKEPEYEIVFKTIPIDCFYQVLELPEGTIHFDSYHTVYLDFVLTPHTITSGTYNVRISNEDCPRNLYNILGTDYYFKAKDNYMNLVSDTVTLYINDIGEKDNELSPNYSFSTGTITYKKKQLVDTSISDSKNDISISVKIEDTQDLASLDQQPNVFSKEDSFSKRIIPTNSYISCIEVSPEKSLIAFGESSDDLFENEGTFSVSVLSTNNKEKRFSFDDNVSSIKSIDFDPSRRNILIADHRNIKIHELSDGKAITSIKAPNYVLDAKFVTNDKIVVLCGYDKVAYLYNIQGKLLNTINTNAQINAFTFNLSKNELIFAGHSTIQLWSLQDLKLIKELPSKQLMCAAINPSNTQIAFGAQDGTILLYSADLIKTGELQGHFMPVLDLDYNVSGTMLISGSSDQSFRIWNINNQEEIKEVFNEHRDMVHAVRFIDVANSFATGGNSNEIKIWEKKTDSLKNR